MIEVNKTLIILTPGFAADEADTTCLPFLQGHVDALNKNFPGTEVIILAFQYPFVKATYQWHNTEVISFGGKERGKFHRLKIWAQAWHKLMVLKRSKNILGIFSLWCTECALIGSCFGKFYGLKHYNWLCGQDAKAGNKYVKLIRPKSNELIAMSDFLKREFYTNYHILPTYVIPIGVDAEQSSKVDSTRPIDLLGAGSLIPLKQYDVFVKVIHQLNSRHEALNTIICGKGPEEEQLNKLILNFKIQNNISLAGEIPHNEVLKLMKRTKIFLHTSNYEGFGTVCLEALCAGTHVVSFTKPMDGHIDHWHHVTNFDEMVEKVSLLLNDKGLSHDPVIPYSSNVVAKIMMELYV